MLPSPYYDRLLKVVALADAEQLDPAIFSAVQEDLTTIRQTIEAVRRNPGFRGELQGSIKELLDEEASLVAEYAARATYLNDEYTKARQEIDAVKESTRKMVSEIRTPAETAALQEEASNGSYGYQLKPYIDKVAEARNEQREREAQRILEETNAAFDGFLTGEPTWYKETPTPGDGSDSAGTSSPRRSPSPADAEHAARKARDARWLSSGSVLRPTPDPDVQGVLRGHLLPSFPPPDEPPVRWEPGPGGSIRPVPVPVITDPDDPGNIFKTPFNPRMTPQGPVGGYIPPDALNADDPRWSPSYRNPALNGPPKAPGVNIVGGVLSTGAAATAAGAGAAGTTGGIGGTGTPIPGYPLGMGGAAAPGSSAGSPQIRGGVMRPAGTPGSTTSGTGQGGTQSGRPVPGMWSAPPGAKDKEDKQRRSLVGYEVSRLYKEDPPPVDSEKFGSGTVEDLKPIPRDIDNDRW